MKNTCIKISDRLSIRDITKAYPYFCGDSEQNMIRAYKSSPERITLQIRGTTTLTPFGKKQKYIIAQVEIKESDLDLLILTLQAGRQAVKRSRTFINRKL